MRTKEVKKGRIFANPILEQFTKTNPRMTIVFYSFLIALFLLLSINYTRLGPGETLALYVGGIFTWTLMEYILHRFIFHIDKYLPFMKRFHYIVHGVHHENPFDKERLFMPPLPGTIIAIVMFFFWFLFIGNNAFAFMGGISSGYLMYSYIHYSVHTKAHNHFLHPLWLHHTTHHFRYPDKAFGVSSPLWDFVFRTMPPKKNKSSNNFQK